MNFTAQNKKENGFTIIEIIIAIFILCIGIIGVYSAFSAVSILTSDSADRLVAAYLSQEGIEIIRNIRDANWLLCFGSLCYWTDHLTDCAAGCEVDYKNSPIGVYSSGGTHGLIIQWANNGRYLETDSDGFYRYLTNENPTKFKRKVSIILLGNYAMRVVSEVSWDKRASILGGALKAGEGDCNPLNCVKTEDVLYDWF